MKALILAAGFGTRLKPWTDHHPKALVPVGGRPMLERVLRKFEDEGFNNVAVNVHHFADQIKDFLGSFSSSQNIMISDESEKILDTGGGVLKASELLVDNNESFLVHNVDILSDAPLNNIMRSHEGKGSDITLVTSDRKSSRGLVFSNEGRLKGWHDRKSDVYKPSDFIMNPDLHESSFSGIYVIGSKAIEQLRIYKESISSDSFPIMDFFLWAKDSLKIDEIKLKELNLIDIGKPETLERANAQAW